MRIMGNLYTDNLIGTVIGLSVADDWEGARREWEIVGCEVDETHSARKRRRENAKLSSCNPSTHG